MFIVLIGPPGSGKGTQSQRLRTTLRLPHLSTGEMLRKAIRERTPMGIRLADSMEEGGLASDELILDLMSERITQPDCHKGCLFDGFPRTLPQAEQLDVFLASRDWMIERAIEIDVAEHELTRRITRRAKIEGRADDTYETLQKRLRVYRSQTMPLLSYYRARGLLRTVPGAGSPEDISRRILSSLEN